MLISLTFDDGPNTVTTPKVLDILEEEGIVASFFLVGDQITPESAEVARRAKAMGCDLENHARTHRPLDRMTAEEIRAEADYCTGKILEISGEAPTCFRPPYIAVNQTVFDSVDLTMICGLPCEDWEPSVSAEERARRVLAGARDGTIVLLHDMPGNDNTVEALKTIIPELKRRGFGFCTCAGLFRRCGVTPRRNRLYSNVFQETDRP